MSPRPLAPAAAVVASALAVATLLVGAPAARAQPQLVEPASGTRFEKAPAIDGRQYLCLGSGIRKKAVFKVYAVAYCVEDAAGRAAIAEYFAGPGKAYAGLRGEALAEELEDDPAFFQALMAGPVPKAARMVFVRDVSAKKMKASFEESLIKVLGKAEKPRVDAFVGLLQQDLREGDNLLLRTSPDGTIQVGLEGDLKTLKDPVLAAAVWQPYLGKGSVASSLKESVAKGVAALRQ